MQENIERAQERLKLLEGEFLKWRASGKRSRTPSHFWDAAVELSQELGVSPVCKKLGLNHSALKKLVESRGPQKRVHSPQTPHHSTKLSFIEVPLQQKVEAKESRFFLQIKSKLIGSLIWERF